MAIPSDPVILLSFINTALRDTYSSLDEFCKATGENKDAIIKKLDSINYSYDDTLNKFV